MSDRFDCQLTLALPAVLEEEVLDALRAQTQWVSGFTIVPGEGFGAGAQQLSAIEQVMGRARRRLVHILMRRDDVAPLCEVLARQFQAPDMAWWVTPIAEFGRFA